MAIPTKRPVSVDALAGLKTLSIAYVDRNTGKLSEFSFNPRKELRLTGRDIDKLVDEHPAQVFYWAFIRECLEVQVRKAEERYSETWRKYYRAFRMKLTSENHGVTEQWIKNETDDHSEVRKRKEKVDAIREHLALAQVMCTALDHRRSMIVRASR